MTTWYIDPTWTGAANGTFSEPFNAWGSTVWWVNGDTYLQKEGTTVSSTVTVFNNGPYFLGTYNATDGSVCTDTSRRAKIVVVDGKALALGTIGASRKDITIDNLECRGGPGTTTFREGISGAAAAKDTDVNITIRRCKVDGNYGISLSGAKITVEDCEIGGYNNPLLLLSTKCFARRNAIAPGAMGYDGVWDGITVDLSGGLTPDFIEVSDNVVTAIRGSTKQGIYLYAGGGPSPTPSGSVLVERNTVNGIFNQSIYCSFANARIRYNTTARSSSGNPLNDESRHFTIIANGCLLEGNVGYGAPLSRAIGLNATSGTTQILNNTFVDCESGLSAPTGTHTVIMKNNSFTRSLRTFQAESAMRFVNKLSTVTLTVENNHYYWPNGDFYAELSTGVNPNWATWLATYEPTARTGDAELDDNFVPSATSPLYQTGEFVGYSLDAAGRLRNNTPSIGAMEAV